LAAIIIVDQLAEALGTTMSGLLKEVERPGG
jgi:hypothetical protein